MTAVRDKHHPIAKLDVGSAALELINLLKRGLQSLLKGFSINVVDSSGKTCLHHVVQVRFKLKHHFPRF